MIAAPLASDLSLLLETTTRRMRERTVHTVATGLERALQKAFRAQGKRVLRLFERRMKSGWPQTILRASGRPLADPAWPETLRRVGIVFTDDQEQVIRARVFAGDTAGAQMQILARLAEADLPADLDAVLAVAARETAGAFVKPIQAAAGKALASGANVLIAQLDLSVSFTLKDPWAVAYLAEHGADLVAGINETTRDAVRGIVTQAAEEGWSYSRTAQAISTRFREFAVGRPQEHIDSRAHLIAVTESGEAYMSGQHGVVADLTAGGLRMEKAWSTMGDDRVSEGCQENEAAGWIDAAAAFPSGHLHPLRFPGCRCDAQYRQAP